MTTTKDNFKQTSAEIAKRILANPLANLINPHTKEKLALVAAESPSVKEFNLNFCGLTFHRGGSSADLNIEMDSIWMRRDTVWTDKDGNEFSEFTVKVDVNYPCHGSASPSIALSRASLIHDVAMLAADLEAEFAKPGREGYWVLVRTAEEAREAKKQERARLIAKEIEAIVSSVSAGMRVNGTDKWLNSDADIPDGVYEHTCGVGKSKKFTVNVSDHVGVGGPRIVCVHRVA